MGSQRVGHDWVTELNWTGHMFWWIYSYPVHDIGNSGHILTQFLSVPSSSPGVVVIAGFFVLFFPWKTNISLSQKEQHCSRTLDSPTGSCQTPDTHPYLLWISLVHCTHWVKWPKWQDSLHHTLDLPQSFLSLWIALKIGRFLITWYMNWNIIFKSNSAPKIQRNFSFSQWWRLQGITIVPYLEEDLPTYPRSRVPNL